MKITFFLIAFCLVFMRMYFSWTGHWGRGDNEGTMVSTGDNFDVKIKWSGKVKFNDDETAIASITPGGYLRYTNNDKKMFAESNLQGDISYTLYDGHQTLVLNDSGKKFLATSIMEMNNMGYDAEGRVDRIAKKGGKKALLEEAAEFKPGYIKGLYLDRLFKNDSLNRDDLAGMLTQIGTLDGDYDKEGNLRRFSAGQLKDSGIVQAWLGVVEHMNSDDGKKNLLAHLIDKDSLSPMIFDKILDISGNFGSDWEKENVLGPIIDNGNIPAGGFGRLLEVIGRFGSDFEKEKLYKKLIAKDSMSEEQWTSLIRQTALIAPDFEKSNLLIEIAKEMPKSDSVKAAYLKAAKSIGTDQEYGRAMRAIE
jgi:hypothetical protein